jgi:DNA-binding NarL/FixJ family response regulator
LAYDKGHSYSEIARWLLLDDETIRPHVSDYFREKKLKLKVTTRAYVEKLPAKAI